MPSQVRHGLIPGALSALLYLILPLSGGIGVLPGLVAPSPLIYAALAGGLKSGVIAVLFAAVCALAIGGVPFGLGHLVSAGLPGLLAGVVLLRQRPDETGQPAFAGIEGLVQAALVYALTLLAGAFLYLSGGVGIEAELRTVFEETLSQLPPEFDETVRAEMIGLMVGITPGVPVALIGAALVVNGLLAIHFAGRLGTLSRPPLSFAALRVPDRLFVAFAAAFLIAQVLEGDLGFMAGQASMVLAMPFLLVGLSVVHAWSIGKPGRGVILGFTYGLMIIGLWPAIVTVLGLADHVFGLKARIAARVGVKRSGKDEE